MTNLAIFPKKLKKIEGKVDLHLYNEESDLHRCTLTGPQKRGEGETRRKSTLIDHPLMWGGSTPLIHRIFPPRR